MNRRAGKPTTKKTTQLVNVEEHVEGFRQVREAHRRELIDDYVELISDLIREVGEARQVDMAARLGVSQPTVAKMLKRLASVGTIRESLHAVVQLAFFRVIHFVDKGIAKSAYLNGLNVAYVKIGV
mgnify:CR=1 FL=1